MASPRTAARTERVLITGGAGFIGAHLAAELTARGCAVVPVDDLRVAPLQPPPAGLLVKSVLDLDRSDLDGITAVYHLASHKSVPESFERPLDYLDNVDSGRHLLRLCEQAGTPRVLVGSTCEVYGNSLALPNTEAAPLAPRSPYASSKVALEMIARNHQQRRGSRVTVVRLFNVYGPGERADALVPALCLRAAQGRGLPIEGTGRQCRDFSYVADTVHKLAGLLHAPPAPTVNLGSGRSRSVLEVAALLREIRPGLELEFQPGRRDEIDEFRADTTVQDGLLGLPPAVTGMREGVRRTYDWWAAGLVDVPAARTPLLVKELT
ncbi:MULTISPECIES: NAD-dependent epimerase/dehydratase family protein [Actinosynnema]|uniref:Epimerase n=1 Tax=Actinosynnema pretiosum TaxID=42197 RepID=A0A290Z5N8_9PSEU|nr:NAD-dependent epimerase/dehydratase family protein [Actinosynnema pretiosum]ATE54304.1 epimerase [Actinosynnema pretiosum]